MPEVGRDSCRAVLAERRYIGEETLFLACYDLGFRPISCVGGSTESLPTWIGSS